jgi:maleylpyruvate isomerase
VRIGLAIKGVDYEYEAVHLVEDGGKQHAPGYRAHNPMRQVPLLEWEEDGETKRLSQSIAILEFLDERYPEPSILPGSAHDRGRIRQLAEVVNSGIQPLQNLAVIQRLRDELDQDAKEWCAYWIRRGLVAYDAMVRDEDGPFSIGDTPTLADACLIPQLYNARRFDVELDDLERLMAIEKTCFDHRAFQVSHPDEQPDAAG